MQLPKVLWYGCVSCHHEFGLYYVCFQAHFPEYAYHAIYVSLQFVHFGVFNEAAIRLEAGDAIDVVWVLVPHL